MKRFYDYAGDAEFSEALNKGDRADVIFELAREKPVIVNLPANVFPLVNNWIKKDGYWMLPTNTEWMSASGSSVTAGLNP